MINTRNMVLSNLLDVFEEGRLVHHVIADSLGTEGLTGQDRAFIKKLTQGTVERMLTLDYIINQFSKVSTVKQKPVIRNILRMGVYQIVYMKVPDSAACNEAVKLARKRGFGTLSGFVNGVLRSIARAHEERENFYSLPENTEERLGIVYSCPLWLVNYLIGEYGQAKTEEMLKYFLQDNKTSVRVLKSRISKDELKERLTARGIEVEETGKNSIKLSGYSSLEELEEFKQGFINVQDISSARSIEAIPIDSGISACLDLCAAPGGKTIALADRLKTESPSADIRITACDISEHKLELIRSNIARCGFDNIDTVINDATQFNEEFENAFDIVIADVPCSGLGIIGKKPDVKYNMDPYKQTELKGLQEQILCNAVRYVKPGGYLLFSTCTINRMENEDNAALLNSLGMTTVQMRQQLPGIDGGDGFFYACMKREQK